MNAKISSFVICVESIIYLLSYNFHDCTFKLWEFHRVMSIYIQHIKTFVSSWYASINVDYNCLDLYIWRSFFSFYFILFCIQQCSSITTFSRCIFNVISKELNRGNAILCNFKHDSVIPKKFKFRLCFVLSAESSSMWKGSEEIFEWKNDRCLSEFLRRGVIS